MRSVFSALMAYVHVATSGPTNLCDWKTWPCGISWPSINKPSSVPSSGHRIDSSGSGCPVCGRTGNRPWHSCSPAPSSLGRRNGFAITGDGSVRAASRAVPPSPKKSASLIQDMWRSNPTWGSPRIVGELRKLGINVAKSTVEKYRPKSPQTVVSNVEGLSQQPCCGYRGVRFFYRANRHLPRTVRVHPVGS